MVSQNQQNFDNIDDELVLFRVCFYPEAVNGYIIQKEDNL